MKVIQVNDRYINLKAITSVVVDGDDYARIYIQGEPEEVAVVVRGKDAVASLVNYLANQAIAIITDDKK